MKDRNFKTTLEPKDKMLACNEKLYSYITTQKVINCKTIISSFIKLEYYRKKYDTKIG